MPDTTRKAVRQKLIQTVVLEKIEREHLSVDTAQVRNSLRKIRGHVQGKTMLDCVARWEQLIQSDDLDLIRSVVLAPDEIGAEMRNLSPLTSLLTEQ
ncbi:hypothetical protein [Rhodococcus sp. NPDC058514]